MTIRPGGGIEGHDRAPRLWIAPTLPGVRASLPGTVVGAAASFGLALHIREQTNDFLGRISVATATSDELATLGDRLVGVFIDEARSSGCTWADIGGHLGVSKQAAQKRYATQWASLSAEAPDDRTAAMSTGDLFPFNFMV